MKQPRITKEEAQRALRTFAAVMDSAVKPEDQPAPPPPAVADDDAWIESMLPIVYVVIGIAVILIAAYYVVLGGSL